MSETQDWAAAISAIKTVSDLGHEMKRRRIAAGFDSVPELLRNVKQGFSLPKSTAYVLEEGSQRNRWPALEAHLRACDVKEPEIELWRDAHRRAVSNWGMQEQQSESQSVAIPTAKQLAEMGPEQGARILSEIDTETAADLLRRIDLQHAVQLLPEIHLSVVLSLLAEVGQARATLIFERVKTDRGAELLAEMKTEDALAILDELAAKRAAELVAAMPRGRAAKLLRSVTTDQTIRILAVMGAEHAAALLPELSPGILEKLADTARAQAVAGILDRIDSEVASELLLRHMPDERALEVMARMNYYRVAGCLRQAGEEVAMRLIPRMPAERIGEFFDSLPVELQTDLLTHSLNQKMARDVLGKWIEQRTIYDGEMGLPYLMQKIPTARMADIIRILDTPEAVMILAILDTRKRQQVLTEIPAAEAEALVEELTPDGIARNIAEIPPERACHYLGCIQIQFPGGLLLSRIEPAAAIDMLLHNEDFTSIAGKLECVPPERVALMLQATRAGEAAGIVAHLSIEHAAVAITAMQREFADEMMLHMRQNVDFRYYDQRDMPAEQFGEIRAKRQEFADHLQDALVSGRRTAG